MDLAILFRTARHLKLSQLFFQIKYRVTKPAFVALCASASERSCLKTVPIAKPRCSEGERFTFLNLEHEFAGWNFSDLGSLWTYNQNYFDWLNQEGSSTESVIWIDRFINDILSYPEKAGMALDPYPIALRSINWIKYFSRFPECATPARLNALWSQVKLLERKLEWHLMANHLLEDAYALYIASAFFGDALLLRKASRLLKDQLEEQILPDGAHYEQSPMYHCILLDRLLDCCNFQPDTFLAEKASRMLGHLESIVWNDRSIPLMNDSAYGIAPTPAELFDYARRLGIEWEKRPLQECGYRKLQNATFEAIVDIGAIQATYQPGHTHADIFSYELRLEGAPVIVDTGISTYNKTARRQYERSTKAHNTVSVGGKDSLEVWGGFRVGRRAQVHISEDTDFRVVASHDGFGKVLHTRRFELSNDTFVVADSVSAAIPSVSFIHLAPGIEPIMARPGVVDCQGFEIQISGADKVEIVENTVSKEYNRFEKTHVIEIYFKDSISYSISKR